jgi:hypothetical protein
MNEVVGVDVRAYILVPEVFALHRQVNTLDDNHTPSFKKRDWVLTHIPSGCALLKGITTIKQGKNVAQSLIHGPGDWSFADITAVPLARRLKLKKRVSRMRRVYGLFWA